MQDSLKNHILVIRRPGERLYTSGSLCQLDTVAQVTDVTQSSFFFSYSAKTTISTYTDQDKGVTNKESYLLRL